WVGHAQMSDALATLTFTPIVSARLLEYYQSLSLLDRQNERIHFELMNRCDPWLVEQPFANDRWSLMLRAARSHRTPPVKGGVHRLSRQMAYWQKHQEIIGEYLRSPGPSPFFDIVDPRRLADLLDRAGPTPDFVTLRAIFGALGIRHALDEPVHIAPVRLKTL
ncbi:MAG: hypothetical protein ACNA8W_08935, partial [Bradymonadaceae bacterium]